MQALQAVKKVAGARFKVFQSRSEARLFSQSSADAPCPSPWKSTSQKVKIDNLLSWQKKKKNNVTFFTHKYDLSVILICMNLNIVIYNFYNIISIIIHYIFFSSFDITKQLFPSCKVNIKLSTLELTTYDVHVI